MSGNLADDDAASLTMSTNAVDGKINPITMSCTYTNEEGQFCGLQIIVLEQIAPAPDGHA
jgi:hypothetical protein